MTRTAILVGNSKYASLTDLPCCHNDLLAMKELLEATQQYSEIEIVEDTNARVLKAGIRSLLERVQCPEELFFYFTGHGGIQGNEFYFCATDFDKKRPNTTGLGHEELHGLLRQAKANLVVKVIDACNSGVPLVKADEVFAASQDHGFKNLIQMASCLETQDSFGGTPLSLFTEKLRSSVLSQKEGTIYYADLIGNLRDEFLHNDQTPHFVTQGTGREKFVDDAKCLDELRTKLMIVAQPSAPPDGVDSQALPAPPSLQSLLEDAEREAATRNKIDSFVNSFFSKVISEVQKQGFSDFFDLSFVEHPNFEESTAEGFIIRVLQKENRLDEFVTAKIRRERTSNPLHSLGSIAMLGMFPSDQGYRNAYDLHLNCTMEKAQMKISFTPRYLSLRKIVLVITCAPSLHNCYVFEIASQHSLTDFDEFDADGQEVTRRWFKLSWSQNTDRVAEMIATKLHEVVRDHLEQTKLQLAE